MKSQQAAEREEQQRIKNLVLNYDLRDENEPQDGESYSFPNDSPSPMPLEENPNTKGLVLGLERLGASHSRSDRGPGRNAQRSRKLQLSDVDWYEHQRLGGNGLPGGSSPPSSRSESSRKHRG